MKNWKTIMKIQIKYLLFIFILLMGSITTLNVQTTHADEIPGLQGWYKFDGNMLDSSGNNYHGTSAYPPVLTKDINDVEDTAYYFGSGSRIKLGDIFNMANNDFTISFWFKGDELTGISQLVGKITNPYYIEPDGRGFFIGLRDYGGVDKLVVQLRGDTGGSESRSDEIDETKWHFVALVKSTTSYSVYLDDNPVRTSNTTTGNLSASGYDFSIGNYSSGGRGFAGKMDEVRVYDIALNSGQITSIYEDGLPSNYPPEITSITGIPTQALSAEFNVEVTDPDSVNFTYLWDFGDQNNSTLKNPTHTYDAPGGYIIKVTVTDDTNRTVEGLISVRVGASGLSTIYAPSCSFHDVKAAVEAAVDGDTVVVPAGTATWSSILTIDKEITLKGAGIDKTIIINAQYFNYQGIIYINIENETEKITRVTGFTFQSDQVNESQYHIYVVHESEYRIDNCKFKDGRFYLSHAVAISGVDTWGVIDHCIFDNEAGEKILVTAGNSTWSEPPTMGSDKATYVEDCVFINSPQGHALVSSYGAKTVFRYNEVHDMDIDAHGHCFRVGQQSARHYEIYENDIYMYNRYGRGMNIRGGTGVIFNNRLYQGKPSSSFTDEIKLTDYRAGTDCPNDGCGQGNEGYPLYDQIGRGMNQESEPLYLWNNQIDLDLDEHMDRAVILIVSNARTLKECGELDAEDFIQNVPHDGESNPDFYNNETPKPGYTPYEYPHPLIKATEPGSFNIIPAIQLLLLNDEEE